MARPIFGGNNVSHIGPRVERLDKTGQCHGWHFPAQFLQIRAEPYLKRLRGNGLDLSTIARQRGLLATISPQT